MSNEPITHPVTVVIPALNEEQTIAPLLDALLAGTRQPDEIVVSDGGSTDSTRDIVARYAERGVRLPRLRGARFYGEMPAADLAHPGPLGHVALSRTTKDGDKPSIGQTASRLQRPLVRRRIRLADAGPFSVP